MMAAASPPFDTLPPLFSFYWDSLPPPMSIAMTIIPTWQSASNRMRQRPLLPLPNSPQKLSNSNTRLQSQSIQQASDLFVPKGIPVPPWNINMNRDRFDNVLMALGGSSPGKNITPPDLPTGPFDEPVDLLPLPMPNYDGLADDELQDRCRSTVWINKTPTSKPSNASPQVERESPPPPTSRRGATRATTATNLKEQ
jgi:hypothetical protein